MLTKSLQTFAPTNNIIEEITCEPSGGCDTDNYSFKSYYIRWLVVAGQLVPQLASQIQPIIAASAVGAAGQCPDATKCGFSWTTSTYDGKPGVGQQMSALSAIQNNMLASNLASFKPPFTADSGGTSKQNGAAGTETHDNDRAKPPVYTQPITTGSRAGAGILTAMCLIFTIGGTAWLLSS